MTTCDCSSCQNGVILVGHCVDADGNEWHSCVATTPEGQYEAPVKEDPDGGYVVHVETGDPHNDQVLAQLRLELRGLLDVTIHPIIDQGEEQNADLPAMMAALAMGWIDREEYMPRPRLASLLALTMFTLAAAEREPAGPGKTVRRG